MKTNRIKSVIAMMALFASSGATAQITVSSNENTANDSITQNQPESHSFENLDDDEFEDDDDTPTIPTHRNEGKFLYFGFGYGNIVSEVVNDWYSGSPNNGLEWQAGYEWISKKKIGAGLLYSGYAAWGKKHYGSYPSLNNILFLNYIAPQFAVKSGRETSKWSFAGSLGLGIGIETQEIDEGFHTLYRRNKAGLGINFSARVEFAPTKKFRLYAMISSVTLFISQPELDNYAQEKHFEGYDRASIAIGMMRHF